MNLKNYKEKLYGPFLWMGFNCFEVTEPLKGENLLSLIHFCALFNCSTVTLH